MKLLNKVIIGMLVLSTGACTKKELQSEKFYYGKVEVVLANLPNTPTMDVRFDNKVDSLVSGGAPWSAAGQTAISQKLSVYKKGTNILIADTLITLVKDSTLSFKVGYSEEFGISGFMGQAATVHPDSCMIMMYNNLPFDLQPEGVEIDACLYMWDETGTLVETGIVWPAFTRKKTHPKTVTINLKDAGQYVFKFKDRANGEFLKDQYNIEEVAAPLYGGKFLLINIDGRLFRSRMRFNAVETEL